jgi:rubrerythrin
MRIRSRHPGPPGALAVRHPSIDQAGPVTSAGALMALAQAMEKKAAARYRTLAAGMRRDGDDRLAGLFDFFAAVEDGHAQQIDERSRGMAGRRAVDAGPGEPAPEDLDDDEVGSLLLTRYRALALAVRGEERAFAFYSRVAAAASDQDVRGLAEDLARDELAHAALLRRERRKAWRAERPDGRPRRPPEPPASLAELRAIIAETEAKAAVCHRAVAAALEGRGDVLAERFRDIAQDEEECANRAGRAPGSAPHVGGAGIPDGLRAVEEAFERYIGIAGTARDEAILAEAQRLAARAVHRLATLGRVPPASRPPI